MLPRAKGGRRSEAPRELRTLTNAQYGHEVRDGVGSSSSSVAPRTWHPDSRLVIREGGREFAVFGPEGSVGYATVCAAPLPEHYLKSRHDPTQSAGGRPRLSPHIQSLPWTVLFAVSGAGYDGIQ